MGNCPAKPQGVVSRSDPMWMSMSVCWVTSFMMLSAGRHRPFSPLPQTCLVPQYQPSQLSALRTTWVKPPVRASRSIITPWTPWTVLVSPWPSP